MAFKRPVRRSSKSESGRWKLKGVTRSANGELRFRQSAPRARLPFYCFANEWEFPFQLRSALRRRRRKYYQFRRDYWLPGNHRPGCRTNRLGGMRSGFPEYVWALFLVRVTNEFFKIERRKLDGILRKRSAASPGGYAIGRPLSPCGRRREAVRRCTERRNGSAAVALQSHRLAAKKLDPASFHRYEKIQ